MESKNEQMIFKPKHKWFDHQKQYLADNWDSKIHALFWGMGTGKSKAIIDNSAMLYMKGLINGVLVVAPNGVQRNFSDEVKFHMPNDVYERTYRFIFENGKRKTKKHKVALDRVFDFDGLSMLFMSYDAVMNKDGIDTVHRFLKDRDVLYVLDESHMIKNPGSKRTKRIIATGNRPSADVAAKYKRILTGTPISVGPLDLYTQVRFLDEWFWKNKGLHGATEFRHHFAEYEEQFIFVKGGGKRNIENLIGYKNLEQLTEWVTTIGSRVRKEDVLDLPPKLYSKRYFEMSDEQKQAYEQLEHEMYLEIGGEIIWADLAIVNMLRLQQVTSNYIPVDEGEPVHMFTEKNPRIDCLKEITDETHTQGIIWARFTEDINQICAMLGEDAVRYDGTLSDSEAQDNKEKFVNGNAKWFVANPQKGGTGLTLHMAKTVIYYNNSFRLNDRVQSEDRAHRAGMDDNPVLYIDLVSTMNGDPTGIEQHIVDNLVKKVEVSNEILQDETKEWL